MLSVLIPTFNSEKTIEACLESVKWADEIFICDSFSTDRTLEICKHYTRRIVQHEYINSAIQKNWAVPQVKYDWILQIDSDERIEASLRDEIVECLSSSSGIDGYYIRIKNYVWGRWTRCCGLYPCSQIRLFRKSKGRWSDREVHARLEGLNTVRRLNNHIIHNDLSDLREELEQFVKQVMPWESKQLLKKGGDWHWYDVTLRPAAIFFLYYIGYGGFREGFRGFYLSVYRAFYSFMTYSHLYERQMKTTEGRGCNTLSE